MRRSLGTCLCLPKYRAAPLSFDSSKLLAIHAGAFCCFVPLYVFPTSRYINEKKSDEVYYVHTSVVEFCTMTMRILYIHTIYAWKKTHLSGHTVILTRCEPSRERTRALDTDQGHTLGEQSIHYTQTHGLRDAKLYIYSSRVVYMVAMSYNTRALYLRSICGCSVSSCVL